MSNYDTGLEKRKIKFGDFIKTIYFDEKVKVTSVKDGVCVTHPPDKPFPPTLRFRIFPGDKPYICLSDHEIVEELDEDAPSFAYDPEVGNKALVYYYRRQGINVMPLRVDGTKAPKMPWKPYMTKEIPWWVLQGYFSSLKKPSGIGLICGSSSGNLEIIDFDNTDLFPLWCNQVGDVSRFPVIETPSGGKHVVYRCETIEGNQGLAWSAKGEIWIETRGQGGQAVLPGSPLSTHPLETPYRLAAGSFSRIPMISPLERERLLGIARGFNKKVTKVTVTFEELYGVKPRERVATGDRPGDDFNARATWGEILEPKGWTQTRLAGDKVFWLRPNNDGADSPSSSQSASTGYCGDRLYVFSTSAYPFEAEETYSKFDAYCRLYHDGDYSEGARKLAERGFGGNETLPDYEELCNTIIRGKDHE